MGLHRLLRDVQLGGNNFQGVLVLKDDMGWLKKENQTKDAPDGVASFIQNVFHAGRMPQMLPALLDKAYTLTPVAGALYQCAAWTKPAAGA